MGRFLAQIKWRLWIMAAMIVPTVFNIFKIMFHKFCICYCEIIIILGVWAAAPHRQEAGPHASRPPRSSRVQPPNLHRIAFFAWIISG